MYVSIGGEYYCEHMATNVYRAVRDGFECAQNMTWDKSWRPLQLFPASGPLEFVAIDILRPSPKTLNAKQYVLVMTDFYSNLTRAIPMCKKITSRISSPFINSWIMPYGIPTIVLTDSGKQFSSKSFELLCAFLKSKNPTTMAYHTQTIR